MDAKVQVIFYSMFGHVYKMAEEVAAGLRDAGADVQLYQVPELVPDEALERTGAKAARQAFAHPPGGQTGADGRNGRHHFRHAHALRQHVRPNAQFPRPDGPALVKRGLVGKVGSVFTSTATQHGGQETTITSFHSTMPW